MNERWVNNINVSSLSDCRRLRCRWLPCSRPHPRFREWEDSTFKRFRVSSYPVHVYVQHCPARPKPKPVWPINTSITTQLLTLPPDTDFLGGPVFRLRLLVKFRFIWASISRCTNLLIYLLLIIVWNHNAECPNTGTGYRAIHAKTRLQPIDRLTRRIWQRVEQAAEEGFQLTPSI